MDSVEPKKSVTWVTPDYFVDCDFNLEIFTGILKHYKVHWIVLLPINNSRFKESDFEAIGKLQGLSIEFMYWRCRARSPKMLIFYEALYQRIKKLNAELLYFNEVPINPYILPLYWRLNKRNSIFTAHDGSVKFSFKIPWLAKIIHNAAYITARFVNMFSETQASLFKRDFKNSKIFIIPLALKDFGECRLPKREDAIIFLFFGSINVNKNLGLLIEAACNLHEKGIRGFKVCIHGYCNDWANYQLQVRYPEIFEIDIRLHQNNEIPVLFATSHYGVFPYKEISQSGALKVAFNYNLPVITSDLEGFTDEVKNGINGFVFNTEDVNDLERVMRDKLSISDASYNNMVKNIATYNKNTYANDILVKKYVSMFNEILNIRN